MLNTAQFADIKRFAVHDGPGIRTTLFLKGCSLACKWCHNPETILRKPELAIHYEKCVLCGDCAKLCDNHILTDSEHKFRRDLCTACGKCTDACLFGALDLVGKTITAERAAEMLLDDKVFYSNGGGITVSGGEPLLQADFCAELFALLKRENIHCAVDTCGNVPWSEFEKVLSFTDMFLYDFKVANPQKHKDFTGVSNALLLENLKKLDLTGKQIEIRMIQIPGWNMAPAEIEEAAAFLAPLKHLTAVRLLSYHSLAHSKYAAVGRADTMPAVPDPTADELNTNAEILRHAGIPHVIAPFN